MKSIAIVLKGCAFSARVIGNSVSKSSLVQFLDPIWG